MADKAATADATKLSVSERADVSAAAASAGAEVRLTAARACRTAPARRALTHPPPLPAPRSPRPAPRSPLPALQAEAYLGAHPELQALIGAFTAAALEAKPADVIAFAKAYFEKQAAQDAQQRAGGGGGGGGGGAGGGAR